ncbi:hypothetical protein BTA51_27300 [Hahella sp. CCB-MM4]|uniref:HvfC/BufC N-terminal domain-containing protein n=1 Tax=Hahella sp. (strain CCB-MM4) TaxID=1926491 RepID=UPI000B9B1837|nr:putative DNA-binding domain-containing protein [Hahella sp. CCB-MM4]OZG70184.1 hypothetical protein BTA51_27300 [Hahella sp. CCB-MM4]
MNLHDLQKDFLDYLYLGSDNITNAIEDTFLARLSIYRNNVSTGITNYLREVFPVTEKLVGPEFFDAMCERFLAQDQPGTGDIHQYGSSLPEFMATFGPLSALTYLPDIARLEWHHHRAYYAQEFPALDLNMGQEALLNYKPDLNASVFLLRSPHPIDTIWQQVRENEDGIKVDLNAGAVALLIFRHRQQVQIWNLSDAAAALLEAVKAGHTLSESIEEAFSHPGSEMLQEFISQCLQAGIICQSQHSQTNR